MISDGFANTIATHVNDVGGRTFFVGGCVRDDILGVPYKDIDLEVFRVPPGELISVLQGISGVSVDLCGQVFGILKVTNLESKQTIDVGLPRTDRRLGGFGHKNFRVTCDPGMSVLEASKRRDLTINSLYRDVVSEELLDYHGGTSDIQNRLIRCVDESRFMEDPLRILRAIQFAARFNSIIELHTYNLMSRNVDTLQHLCRDGIFVEFTKLLMKAEHPSYGLQIMYDLGILDLLIPELSVLQFVDQNLVYHPEGNVFEHLKRCVDYTPVVDRTRVLQYAALFHDVGKVYGTRKHEIRSVEITKQVIPRVFTDEIEFTNDVTTLIAHHMELYGGDVTRARVKKLASRTDLPTQLKLYEIDKFSRGLPESQILTEKYEYLDTWLSIYSEVQNEVAPIIFWRDIPEELAMEVPAGPKRSILLKLIYDAQLNDEFTSKESALPIIEEIFRRWI